MEVAGEGDYYTYRYTVTTRMTLMRAILMIHNCEGQSRKTVHRPQLLKKKGSRSGFESRSLSAYSVTPYRYVKPAHQSLSSRVIQLHRLSESCPLPA